MFVFRALIKKNQDHNMLMILILHLAAKYLEGTQRNVFLHISPHIFGPTVEKKLNVYHTFSASFNLWHCLNNESFNILTHLKHFPQYGHMHFTILLFIFITNHMHLEPEKQQN